MGMLDGKPFVPRTGAPVYFRHRKYVLRWTPEYGRTLFGANPGTVTYDKPQYRLVPMGCTHCCSAAGQPVYHFDVYSIRTGKKLPYARFTCYMVRVDEHVPMPKRPWWHDGKTPFRRNDPWFCPA